MSQAADLQNDKHPKKKVFLRGGFWWIVLSVAMLATVVIWLSRAFDKQPEQYAFIATAVLNILILAAIMVQALIYRRQWDVMSESTELARRALYVSNRPYVVIGKIIVNLPLEADKAIIYQVVVENKGRTPANNLQGIMYIDTETYLLPDDPPYRSVRTGVSKITLGSDKVVDLKQTSRDVPSQEQIGLIADKKLFVYIWGVVRYEEEFTDKTHRTRFYSIYDPEEDRFVVGNHHNDAD